MLVRFTLRIYMLVQSTLRIYLTVWFTFTSWRLNCWSPSLSPVLFPVVADPVPWNCDEFLSHLPSELRVSFPPCCSYAEVSRVLFTLNSPIRCWKGKTYRHKQTALLGATKSLPVITNELHVSNGIWVNLKNNLYLFLKIVSLWLTTISFVKDAVIIQHKLRASVTELICIRYDRKGWLESLQFARFLHVVKSPLSTYLF